MTDLSGNGATGLLAGATTTVAGKLGQALSFDGATNEVTVSNPPNLNIPAYTISGWFKTTNGAYQALIYEKYSTFNANQKVFISSNQISFDASDDIGTSLDCSPPANLTDGTWHHFALVQTTTTTGKMYIDDIVQCTSSGSVTSFSGSPNLFLGSDSNGSIKYTGSLDDVRIYNRALSPTDVARLYKLGH